MRETDSTENHMESYYEFLSTSVMPNYNTESSTDYGCPDPNCMECDTAGMCNLCLPDSFFLSEGTCIMCMHGCA